MLFLQENVTQNTGNVSIMEANSMLIEAMMQLNSLNEAALQADFSIHSSLNEGVLSENDAEKKKDNLFKKVKDKLVATLEKVRDALVKFFKAVFLRIKYYFGKIIGTVVIAKEPTDLLNIAMYNLDKHIGFRGEITSEKVEALEADVGKHLDRAHLDLDRGSHTWVTMVSLSAGIKFIKSQEDAANKSLKKYNEIINEIKKLKGQSESTELSSLRIQASNLDKVVSYQRRSVAVAIRIIHGAKVVKKVKR